MVVDKLTSLDSLESYCENCDFILVLDYVASRL
jgi:hypothetical protein